MMIDDEIDDLDVDAFEADIEDADWDETDNSAAVVSGTQAPPRRRSFLSRNFNVIVIAVTVLIGAAVFYFQFLNAPSAPTPLSEVAADASENMDGVSDDVSEAADDAFAVFDEENDSAESDYPLAPDLIEGDSSDIAETEDSDNALTPLPDVSDSDKELPQLVFEDPVDGAFGDEDAVVEVNPSIPPLENEETTPVATSVPAEPDHEKEAVLSDVSAEKIQADFNTRIHATDAKIDQLAQSIAALERKIDALDGNNKISSDVSTKVSATAEPVKTPEPKEKKEIVQKSPSSLPSLIPDEDEKDVSIQKMDNSDVKDIVAPSPIQKASPEKTVPTPSATNTVPAPAKTPKVVWELRSVRAGRAIVAEKGSSKLHTVAVGDTLSGIGRIKSISNATGVWEVKGTYGTIRP